MYPHRIRLRGPWEAEPLDPPGPPRRVALPATLAEGGLGECRRVRFTRRFGRPRKLDDFERVWLIGEGLGGRAAFRVNDTAVGTHAAGTPFEFPVTALLGERNELVVELENDDAAGGLWGDVALEVRCTAWLRAVRVTAEGQRLRIAGEVRGDAEGPLDLYVLVDGRTAGYAACREEGPFEVVTDDLTAPGDIRVELVNGAVVWYVSEISL